MSYRSKFQKISTTILVLVGAAVIQACTHWGVTACLAFFIAFLANRQTTDWQHRMFAPAMILGSLVGRTAVDFLKHSKSPLDLWGTPGIYWLAVSLLVIAGCYYLGTIIEKHLHALATKMQSKRNVRVRETYL